MKDPTRSRSKLPALWTAHNAAHRALENAGAFSTSFNRHHRLGACSPAAV